MKNTTENGDGRLVVLPPVVPLAELPVVSPEKADDVEVTVVGSIINQTKDFIMRLGLPSLLVYNGVRSSAVGAAVGFVYEGGTFDRIVVGAAAGGLNLITSQTFWAAMAIVGTKVGGRFLKKRRHLQAVS